MHDVTVILSDEAAGRAVPDPERLERFAAEVLGAGDSEVNIILADDARLAELNERYRKRAGATDVLSFTLSEPGDPMLVGEVYVSLDRAAAQAVEYGVTPAEEVVRLVTHGLLHLTGRVHDTGERLSDMNADTEAFIRRFFDGERA